MKYFFLIAAALTINSYANPVRVQGIGSTFEEAKNNAFKTAIELKVGSVLTNELETKNGKLIRNEISNYSAGYIENFKIIQEFKSQEKIYVIIEANVSTSKIADRILGTSNNAKSFNNEMHSSQYNTYIQTRQSGDKLLTSILNDYPKKAFVLKQGNHSITLDNKRNAVLHVEYELGWNLNYIKSLNEALSLLEDNKNIFNIKVIYKEQKSLFNSVKNFQLNDEITFNKVKNTIANKSPYIQLFLKHKDGSIIHQNCLIPSIGIYDSFYKDLSIYSNNYERNFIKVNLNNDSSIMNEISEIELKLIGINDCKK